MPEHGAIGTVGILNAKDILDGSQGTVIATLPDGSLYNMMHVKNIEANVSYDKEQVAILGKRGKGNRKTGETYSGSMTTYFVSSMMRNYAHEYKDSGKDFYFDLQIVNEDHNTDTGMQVVILKDCNLDSMVLAKLDADNSILEEDLDFTFEDWTIETPFTELDGFKQL